MIGVGVAIPLLAVQGVLKAPSAPRLLACRLSASPGTLRIYVYDSVWTPTGKVKYGVVRVSDETLISESSFYPGSAGTSYASGILVTGLTIGEYYRLDYWLDCIPDVAGYVEGWYPTTLYWTQPDILDPEIDLNYNG